LHIELELGILPKIRKFMGRSYLLRAAGIKKSQHGAPFSWPTSPHMCHRHPDLRPKTSPRKDKSAAHRAAHSLATATEGGYPRGKAWVTLPSGQASAGTIPSRPDAATAPVQRRPQPRPDFLVIKIFLGGGKAEGSFSAGVSPGGINGIDENMEVGSGPGI